MEKSVMAAFSFGSHPMYFSLGCLVSLETKIIHVQLRRTIRVLFPIKQNFH